MVYSVGQIVPLRSGTRFRVVELAGGHVWVEPIDGGLPGISCLLCGYMQRRDKQNKTCPGVVRLALRAEKEDMCHD